MITVRLKGGLGNQMFQYALGRALQHRRGDELRLDAADLLGNAGIKWDVPREYALGIFGIQPSFGCGEPASTSQTLVEEKEFGFHPEILDLTAPNIYLDGYWQSDSYFAEIRDQLREAFHFQTPLSDRGREMAQGIAGVNAVCLHVRRGDYVTVESSRNALGFVGEDFYRRGVAWIKMNIQDPQLFIASDDLPWCREHLKFDLPTTYFDEGGTPSEDLHLMSLCKHFLISNSTFAWWAAWLAGSADKRVVAPKRWFGIESIDPKDLFPSGWVTL